MYMNADLICGIDEAGRGAWAGPMVSAAVVLGNVDIPELADSKTMTPRLRKKVFLAIQQQALAIGTGWVSAQEIDERGLTWAQTESMSKALAYADSIYDSQVVVVDGKINYLKQDARAMALVKADSKYKEVMAASIVAKVLRDAYMDAQEKLYNYGFDSHKGYGTLLHRQN